MRSYEAARGLFSFLSICAWGVIIIGVIVALIGGNAAASGIRGQTELQVLLGAAPGAIVAVAGFFGLALVQMGRASVDSAEYGQQALEVSRQQLEVSREVLAQGKTAAASYAALLKRQPSMKARPTDASDNAPAEPSYGTRVEPTEPISQLDAGARPAAVANAQSTSPAQLEHKPALSMDDALPAGDPVVSRNGMWHVGDRTFQSETPARNYAATLEPGSKAETSDA